MDERRSGNPNLKHKKIVGAGLLILSFSIIILLAIFIYLLSINQLANTDKILKNTIANLEDLDSEYKDITEKVNLNDSNQNTKKQITTIETLLTYYNNNLNVLKELKKDPTISQANKDQLDRLINTLEDKMATLENLKSILELHILKLKLNETLTSFDKCIKDINFAQKDNLKISKDITKCVNTAQDNITSLKQEEQNLMEFFKDCNKDNLPVERVESFINIYTNMATYYRYVAQKQYDKAKIYDSKYQESIKAYNSKPSWDTCINEIFKEK